MDTRDGSGAAEAVRQPVQSAEFRTVEVLLTAMMASMGRRKRVRFIKLATQLFEGWGDNNGVVPITWRKADEAAGRAALAWWRSKLPGMMGK